MPIDGDPLFGSLALCLHPGSRRWTGEPVVRIHGARATGATGRATSCVLDPRGHACRRPQSATRAGARIDRVAAAASRHGLHCAACAPFFRLRAPRRGRHLLMFGALSHFGPVCWNVYVGQGTGIWDTIGGWRFRCGCRELLHDGRNRMTVALTVRKDLIQAHSSQVRPHGWNVTQQD